MVFIRADSNPIISGGHIMRCLAIARALVEAGEKVCFLIADDNPVPILKEEHIPYSILDSDWNNLMTDVDKVREILKMEREAILLIDTYQVTRAYVEALNQYCKIAYLGSKKEYLGELDLLVNYSADIDLDFYRDHYKKTVLFLGPSYAPLRKEFQNVVPMYKKRIEHILVTTGNTDRHHIVSAIIEGMLPVIAGEEIKLDVIVGRMFDDKDELHKAYDNCSAVLLHENVKSISAIMKACDLAISANGTTVYELAAMGLPTISFAMVEEQVRSAEALQKLNVIDYCGRSYEDRGACIAAICDRSRFYISHNDDMIALAHRAYSLMDGTGAKRIAKGMMGMK